MKTRLVLVFLIIALLLGLSCAGPTGTTEPSLPGTSAPVTTTTTTTVPTTTTTKPSTSTVVPQKTTDWRYTQWTFTDMSVSPLEAKEGQQVIVKASIYIPGIVERLGTVYLVVDGKVVGSEQFLFYGDEILDVQFGIIAGMPGQHEIRLAAVLIDDEPYVIGQNDLLDYLTVKA